MLLIIGNVVALIASLIMVYTGCIKSKQKILYAQNIQMGLLGISNLVLGGFSGAAINAVGIIRNILCYYNKFGLKEKIFITILSTVLTIIFNNLGLIGYLPLIAIVVYTWLITIKDVVKFKILIIFTLVLWIVYDFTVKSYTACAFDLFTIVTNVIAIISIKNKPEK